MIFFVNAAIQEQKSGIEHAELKRLKLFNRYKEPAIILVRDWDPFLHRSTRNAGIPDNQVISMFDYWQNATDVKDVTVQIQDLDFGVAETHVETDPKNQLVDLVIDSANRLVARVNYTEGREQIRSLEMFDGFGNLYSVDFYDVRGFVSLRQWYTPDNKIGTEVWYTPDGYPVIETFNRFNVDGKLEKSGWRLLDHQGVSTSYDTLEQLTKKFFDDLNEEYWSDEKPNIFILDRAHLGDWSLQHLEKPAYSVLHLHNSHAGDSQKPMDSILNNHYEYSMNVIDGYDAVVSATHKQTDDVEARFHPTSKLFTIPVGVVEDERLEAERIPVSKREFGKIVVFARIAWEKHLDDLVRAVAIVRKKFPEVTLDLYGYADSSDNYRARRAVEDAIHETGLESAVTINEYTTDIDRIQNQAMAFAVTSRMEGFNLAVMEATSHGLISFTYDVNYGPNEIVEDGINGYVVPYEDYKAMAERMIEVFGDKKLAQKLSTGAYDSAERYSSENVWKAWKSLIDDAQATWPDKISKK